MGMIDRMFNAVEAWSQMLTTRLCLKPRLTIWPNCENSTDCAVGLHGQIKFMSNRLCERFNFKQNMMEQNRFFV